MLRGEAPPPAPITVPTCCRWGEGGSVLPSWWGDRMGEYFTDLDFRPLPGVGHFPHWEDPDLASAEIAAFFIRLPDAAWRA
jgi:pimeloyl-ACP methyl ester carboxylesterase